MPAGQFGPFRTVTAAEYARAVEEIGAHNAVILGRGPAGTERARADHARRGRAYPERPRDEPEPMALFGGCFK